jgi:hypothetical protein
MRSIFCADPVIRRYVEPKQEAIAGFKTVGG